MKMSVNKLMETASLFWRSRIILTAFELKIFTALGQRRKTSTEVAKAIKANARATDRLMNALCAMGLLVKRNNKFSNTDVTSRFLIEGRPHFLGGFGHFSNLWDDWSNLTKAVKEGRNVSKKRLVNQKDKYFKAFIAAMHARACESAPSLIRLLDLSKVYRVLDVGGGSGVYSMAFVRAKAGTRAVVFDLPQVTVLAKKYIKAQNLQNKITTKTGDYRTGSFGKGFDLVFLSAIIHINSPKENIKLIKKASAALNPGGQLVISDFIMDRDRTSPFFGALFALNMLAVTDKGDTYTQSEVSSWMKTSGLKNTIRKDTKFGTTLIIARK
jgi:2-polyprenyl-3-methyl-5-hydroxy-6-metoxy-1,4-benzoquinol methylase